MRSVNTTHLLAEAIVERAREAESCASPLMVGVCEVSQLRNSARGTDLWRRCEREGVTLAMLSIDDFYLTAHERELLSHNVHRLLKARGLPGTHDIGLIASVIDDLRKDGEVRIPIFDELSDDRLPRTEWLRRRGPVDVVVLHGWCVGALPETDGALLRPINALERNEDPNGTWRRRVNRALAQDYQRLFRELDVLVMLAPPNAEAVRRWRVRQESNLRKRATRLGIGPSCSISRCQIERSVSHFERLTRHILAEMPNRADLVIQLNDVGEPDLGATENQMCMTDVGGNAELVKDLERIASF